MFTLTEFIPLLTKAIKNRSTVVFCGSGISLHSGLPLANTLVKYVLAKLCISEKDIETILNAALPFESFMELLKRESNIESLLSIFEYGEPNTNNILLAKLARAGYLKTICTTNFDQLIEKAMINEGFVAGKDFHVIYKEQEFDKIDWNDNKIFIIKLHGSVENKENLAITFDRVANRVYSKQRQRVIDYIFSKGAHKFVLVLGYSCSDIFDISPQIEAISENHKEVIFIEHHTTIESKQREELVVEDISLKKDNNPFQHFMCGKRIFYDTDMLIKAIWKSCILEEYFLNSLTWTIHYGRNMSIIGIPKLWRSIRKQLGLLSWALYSIAYLN